MLIVVALGGNALLKRGEPMTAENQRANIRQAAHSLAQLIVDGNSLVVTHGNGPQVGLLSTLTASSPDGAKFPLDVVDAESAGMIGYVLEQELRNILPDKCFATLLTQVKVDIDDPAFNNPTKPIGAVYDEITARRLAETCRWSIARDGGGWRRVVPSPHPVAIIGTEVIELLIKHEIVVICAGGGGIPVVEIFGQGFEGIEAVIDKDLVSSLLAQRLEADVLMMLTDVDAVYADFATPAARRIERIDPACVSSLDFPTGSMGPKIAGAVEFARSTGNPAYIGALKDARAMLRHDKGTVIVADTRTLQLGMKHPDRRN